MDLGQSFDTFLNGILQDYAGQDPTVDRAQATLVFIKSACVASALWGLGQQQKNIARLPFPDQCELPDLIHWATIKGIQNIPSYIDSDGGFSRLVTAVLATDQDPEGAGNENDWEGWAMSVTYDNGDYTESVVDARCYENKRYIGSVDVAIVSSMTAEQGDEGTPSANLLAAVNSYLQSQRVLGIASDLAVRAPSKLAQALTLTVAAGTSSDLCAAIQSDIVSFMKALRVGDSYYPALVSGLAIARGVVPVSLVPNVNVSVQTGPTVYQRIWPDEDNIIVVAAGS